MHNFRIICNQYNEQGALMPGEALIRYADNWEQARVIVNELKAAKYDNGMKIYNVMLSVLSYKQISNITEFFAQFEH